MSKSLYGFFERKSNILKSFPQIEEEPDLHRLDIRGGREAGGHREVDRGQDHHAGDVDGVDHVVPGVPSDVVRYLVYQVHEDCWEIGDQKYTDNLPGQDHGHSDYVLVGLVVELVANRPAVDDVLSDIVSQTLVTQL